MADAPSGAASRRTRAKKTPPPEGPKPLAVIGDNSGAPTKEERREATYRKFMKGVRDAKAALDAVNAQGKAVRKLYTKARNDFKAATDINLKMLDRILEASELHKADLTKDAIDYHWMAEMEAIPVGGQMSLVTAFEKTPDATKDEMDWENDGWRCYGRNMECKPPKEAPTKFHQAWMKGWHGHQEKVIWSMAMPEDEPLGDPAPKAEDADSDEFEASPAELEQQITRQQITAAREGLEALGAQPDADQAEADAEKVVH